MFGLILVVLGFFLVVGPAAAEAPDSPYIHDEADLFRAGTRSRANEQIEAIRNLCERDVVVETMASLPPAERSRVKAMRHAADKASYLASLAEKHAQDAGVNGILILICRDPAFIQVAVWPESERQAFTERDATRLEKLLRRRRIVSDLDQALIDGLNLVRNAYVHNLHLPHPDEGETSNETMAAVILGYVGLWLLLHFANARSGATAACNKHESQPGLFGGKFGHAAGLWIYDRLLVLTPQAEILVVSASQVSTESAASNVPSHAIVSDTTDEKSGTYFQPAADSK